MLGNGEWEVPSGMTAPPVSSRQSQGKIFIIPVGSCRFQEVDPAPRLQQYPCALRHHIHSIGICCGAISRRDEGIGRGSEVNRIVRGVERAGSPGTPGVNNATRSVATFIAPTEP